MTLLDVRTARASGLLVKLRSSQAPIQCGSFDIPHHFSGAIQEHRSAGEAMPGRSRFT